MKFFARFLSRFKSPKHGPHKWFTTIDGRHSKYVASDGTVCGTITLDATGSSWGIYATKFLSGAFIIDDTPDLIEAIKTVEGVCQ